MANVTYLFGAGASKDALPIVSEIPDRLKEFGEFVGTANAFTDTTRDYTLAALKTEDFPELSDQFKRDVDWLVAALENFASIDTLAKKLFLTGEHGDLRRLKIVLSLFFNHRQHTTRPDTRYNSFFASILGNGWQDLPKTATILSWNYDCQFELSYDVFSQKGRVIENQTLLQVHEKLGSINYFLRAFAIYKINGTASFRESGGKQSFGFDKAIGPLDDIYDLFHKYKYIVESGVASNLSFAWEDGKAVPNLIKQRLQDTTILVIIGYSMPFFNRKVDQELISLMPLEKVYIQDLNPNSVLERFLALRPGFSEKNIVQLTGVKQFYLPDELSL